MNQHQAITCSPYPPWEDLHHFHMYLSIDFHKFSNCILKLQLHTILSPKQILRALSAVAVAVVTFLILYLLLGRLCRRCSEWKRFHSVLPTVRLRKGVESEDGEQDVALLLESRDSKDVEEEEEEVEERSSGAVSTPLIEKPSESPSLPHEPVASTEI